MSMSKASCEETEQEIKVSYFEFVNEIKKQIDYRAAQSRKSSGY